MRTRARTCRGVARRAPRFRSRCTLADASGAAWADSDEHARSAGSELVNVDREIGTVQAAVEKAKGEQMTVEERLSNGELLYRTKDYRRAMNVFSEILEKYPEHAELPGRALAPRRDLLRGARVPRPPAATTARLVDRGTDPALPERTSVGRSRAWSM